MGIAVIKGLHNITNYPALEIDRELEGRLAFWESRLCSPQPTDYQTWFKGIPVEIELFADKPANETGATLLKERGLAGLAEKFMRMEYDKTKTPIRTLLSQQAEWIHGNLVKILATIDPRYWRTCSKVPSPTGIAEDLIQSETS